MRVYDAGSDWLTLTVAPDNERFDRIHHRMEQTLLELSGGAKHLKRQQWQGYTGFQSYGLFVGIREDGMCIRASGHESKLIEKIFRAENFNARCTRLDLQITAQIGQAKDDYGNRVQQAIEGNKTAYGRTKAHNSAAYKVAGSHSGVTIGARSSERYSRVYNKSLEQRGRVAPGLWRHEVEFKGQQARLMFNMLMSSANGYYLALSIVKTTMELHGLDCSWILEAEKLELPSSYRQNDNERRLAWLRDFVRPTVHKLIEAVGRDAVLQALDL